MKSIIIDKVINKLVITMIEAFVLNVIMYSILPLYFLTLNTRTCIASFYGYIAIVLFIGGLATPIYSFPFSDTLIIPGGTLAFGAFMMSTVMLIVIQNDISTFRNMIRLVITVDALVFIGLSFMSWLLNSGLVINSFNLSPSIFDVSFTVMLIGGFLIISEIMLLWFIFLQASKYFSNLPIVASIFTLAFVFILCIDGVLFPFIAYLFGIIPLSSDIILNNVLGKLVTAACYSLPLLAFYFIYRKNLKKFISYPIKVNELLNISTSQLLETLQRYELRDRQLQIDKQELIKIAENDKLTSLSNRRKFDDTFKKQWFQCEKVSYPLTLVIGDIDFFKQYNDTYGHMQGDECLKEIAQLWGSAFKRSSDLPARIGGEEFAVIVPNSLVSDVLPNLKKFLQTLHERELVHQNSPISSYVTMSIGVASIIPNTTSSMEELFRIADECLYSAKRNGRNQIVDKTIT